MSCSRKDIYCQMSKKLRHLLIVFAMCVRPCARTNWHTHEGGQLLRCIAGSGWICDRGDKPKRLQVGDTVWCPPGTEHWHGADDGSYMAHFVHAHGKTEWKEAVSDEE